VAGLQTPFTRYKDFELSVTVYVEFIFCGYLSCTAERQMTALVVIQVLKHWYILVTSLFKRAKENKADRYVNIREIELSFTSIKTCQ
jgi:hypothetical protein